jgi:hypothetical protein
MLVNTELKNRRDYRAYPSCIGIPLFHWLDAVDGQRYDFQVTTRRIEGFCSCSLGTACVSERSPSRLGVEFVFTIISGSKLGGYFLLCIKFSG